MDKQQSIKSKTAFTAFYLAVIIEVMMVIIDKSAFTNPIEGRLFQITFLLCFLKICLTKYTKKEYLAIGLFLIIGAISYFVTGRNEMIRVVTFIAACKDIDMMKCLKLVFWMTLTGCMVIILLSITGVLGTVSRTMDYGRGGVETRYVLGMGHPNALHCMLWSLTTLGIYLYYEKLKWYSYAILFGVNICFFILTDSRTGFVTTAGIILFAIIIQLTTSEKVRTASVLLGYLATAGSIFISVFMAVKAYHVYNYAWAIDTSRKAQIYAVIDKLLNGRIRTLVENDNFEGTVTTWSMFSRPENNYYFDMGWVRLFYWYGIIPATLFIVALILLMIYVYRKKQYMASMVIISFSVYSMIEAHAISVYLARNYLLFLLGMYWWRILENKRDNEGSGIHCQS